MNAANGQQFRATTIVVASNLVARREGMGRCMWTVSPVDCIAIEVVSVMELHCCLGYITPASARQPVMGGWMGWSRDLRSTQVHVSHRSRVKQRSSAPSLGWQRSWPLWPQRTDVRCGCVHMQPNCVHQQPWGTSRMTTNSAASARDCCGLDLRVMAGLVCVKRGGEALHVIEAVALSCAACALRPTSMPSSTMFAEPGLVS